MKSFIEPKKLFAVITPMMATVFLTANGDGILYYAYYDQVTTVYPDELSASICFE